MPVRYGYRRFGEDDDFNDLDVEEMLRMLADDFMENGDLEEAMDRLLREGYTTADGERVEGLRDLLELLQRGAIAVKIGGERSLSEVSGALEARGIYP